MTDRSFSDSFLVRRCGREAGREDNQKQGRMVSCMTFMEFFELSNRSVLGGCPSSTTFGSNPDSSILCYKVMEIESSWP